MRNSLYRNVRGFLFNKYLYLCISERFPHAYLWLNLFIMSICSDCIHPKPIARCVTNLIIGTISSINTAVYVFITNLTTERKIRYSVTSSAAGLITIPITPQRFSEDHSYEVHVTLVTAAGINNKQNITIGGEVSDCASLRFETIWDNDNNIVTYTNQTLSL